MNKSVFIQGFFITAAACLGCASVSFAETAPKKPAAKPSASSPARAAAAAPAAITLSPEQISIASIVTTGRIACDDGKSVTITPDAKIQGAFDLQFSGVKYDVVPKPTASGAIRLEDPKSGIVFMQLANKSMLFNEKQSRRLADECKSPEQQAVADQMKANPTAGVLDSPAR